ncbi:MAG TPA: ammonia-forming cytochrome c nitrite reductase subunit c552 [Bryobacteraceae bacterium]|nr:ammonia-forming cytochrome c nitrite reductase subunit c552 [Bryobacteraceae bacterium]HOQ45569.1 ammonia-forming cytochrome c nitrite reductase subunit c552 [Bryobacteraceae bacterium]HPU73393.1 ammonia-forming cytochrome c nitrite reductase subunit c552 [Bryobacteraceae bacterium]
MSAKPRIYILIGAAAAGAAFAAAMLLMNISERKQEARERYVEVVRLTEDTVDPAVWGRNFPRQYDSFKRTAEMTPTRFGGSEPYSRLDRDPRLKRIFAGYAFALEYKEERGHAYSLQDQDETARTRERPQPGSCLQCHASVIPAYRRAGGGDVLKGFELICAMPFREARKLVEHPVACIDCHDPKTMDLRVTRPGFLAGIKALKKSQGIDNYDPNTMATRQEMRTYVCGQCHVEYYFAGEKKLVTYPWAEGLKVEQIEAYYDRIAFSDWQHEETGAPVLKAQHPEFETFSQGIHARSGVACADCHMPYMRQGAVKISDHHVRSPLLNVERACLTCHPVSAAEMKARAEAIQERHAALLDRAEDALIALLDDIKAARAAGAKDQQLAEALKFHRKAQWRVDFVNAENSMGFHAPQESARILAEAIDYARQGQLAIKR